MNSHGDTEKPSVDEEKYFMQQNSDEIQRLTLQHHVIKSHVGRLILAPINFEEDLKVLDSATADGLWLRDLQSSLQCSNSYVGTDIVESYFPPKYLWPPNVTFRIQSITKPWPKGWNDSFDLVHQRFALPAAGHDGINDALRRLVDLVKPGGWIQLVEADHSEFTGPAMGELAELVKDVFARMNVPHDLAQNLKVMLRNMGLECVEERIFDVPLGAKNEDDEMRWKSERAFVMGTDGIVGAARQLPPGLFSEERLEKLKPWVEKELRDMGGVNRIYFIWARKPN